MITKRLWKCCLFYFSKRPIVLKKKKKSLEDTKKYSTDGPLLSSSVFKVLGYLNRNALDTKNLIKEIKAIASIPTERHFFNVSDEADLLEKAGTIGEQIFSIEGKRAPPPQNFLSKPFFKDTNFPAYKGNRRDKLGIGTNIYTLLSIK